MKSELEILCRELEHFHTDKWAADVILKHVELTGIIHDPCVGTGILPQAVIDSGQKFEIITTSDIHDWNPPGFKVNVYDYLERTEDYLNGTTVIMNPPFSKACEFVQKAFDLGAYKVLCFQRKAWRESLKRREFWDLYPPKNIFVCGERATCWRHDISDEERAARGGTPTPHAWFEFIAGNNQRPTEYIIYKDGGMV